MTSGRNIYTITTLGSELFRNKKSKWKRNHYSCYDTYEDVVANKPEQLSHQEWALLTKHWETEAHRALSQQNKGNRVVQVAKHTNGRISFPQLREKINREQGAPPTFGYFFKRTHISRKTNEPLDELSRQYIDKMTELAGRDEHGAEQSISDDIYYQVMPPDRHGRVRLMGRGVTPTSFFGSRTSSSNHNGAHRIEQLENELAEMRRIGQEREDEVQHEIVEMRRQAQEREDEMQREIVEMRRQAQDKEEQRQQEFDQMKRSFKEKNNRNPEKL